MLMPAPVSLTDHDILPGGHFRVSASTSRRLRRLLASTVSFPPSGIASRALIARLTIADSRWLTSASICQETSLRPRSGLYLFAQGALPRTLEGRPENG